MLSNNSTKKGSSLIEVIIVLAIVSLTIISSMSLVARTRIEIKNNEIEDKASDFLLKALEALKTPDKVTLVGNPQLTEGRLYNFSLSKDVSGAYSLVLQPNATSLPVAGSEYEYSEICNSSSIFYLTDENSFNYCQQVSIVKRQNRFNPKNPNAYEIKTTLLYQINGESKSDSLVTYRYEDFK